MPFTPFHLGPGLLIKGLIPDRFSLSMFVLANVAMDVEPLYHLWRDDTQLHGFTHTLFGAGLIGVGSALLGRVAVRQAWRLYERWSANADSPFQITWSQAWLGALIGTFSHLLMDVVMHTDMHPFAPFSEANPLLNISNTENVYLGCVVTGMIGMLIILMRAAFQKKPHTNL